MADQDDVLVVVDGVGATRALAGKRDGSANFRPSHGLRSDGNDVGQSYPLPVQARPIAPVFSTAYEAAHVLKSIPGTLYALQANYTDSGWVLLLDATAIPADGAVVPVKAWQVSSARASTLDRTFNPPLAMAHGIVLVFSSTGPFTKTGNPVAQFSGEVA